MSDTAERRRLSQIAYEAYAEQQHWRNYAGDPIPPWAEVRPDIQRAWDVAVLAVLMDHEAHRP